MARDYTIRRPGAAATSGIDFAAELNEKQLAAVTAPPGPSLVIAGAGSGKTRTLTYRVAYLLDNGIRPDNILLLTFTNKAAREMLDRVAELLPCETGALWGGTFHSVGARILRRHAETLGRERNFSILDREDQKELLGAAVAESGIDVKALRFPKPELIGDIFSLSTNTGERVEDLLHRRYPYFAHFAGDLEDLRASYERKKRESNAMDFDDLLEKTLRLLADNPEVREHYQRQFEWVLVDEYQDTNSLQAELIDLLAAPQLNLMVVGDDAQSIYSWRGADFRNILDFPSRHPGAREFVIETNYRSVPEILQLANAAIAPNTLQFHKNLAPARPDRSVLPALAPVRDTGAQAAFVAQRIHELQDEGVELDEIAVLYRAHFHAMEIQLELTNRGIPFVITSGLRFFEQAHIKDAASFLKFVCNPRDEVAFKRFVRMLPGIGARSADKLWAQWTRAETDDASGKGGKGGKGDPSDKSDKAGKAAPGERYSPMLLDFKVPPKAAEAWEQLAYTLDELVGEDGAPRPPATMLHSVLEGVYEDYMRSKFTNYENRRQDLLQLARYSEEFEDVEDFLTQLSLLAGQDAAEASDGDRSERGKVCLSSVHQAKGLEWRTVFVVWLADGMFPSNRSLESDSPDALEEERRLFYVAVTRARDELYLVYPQMWHGSFSGDVFQTPSRFLEDIPLDLVEEWNVGAAW